MSREELYELVFDAGESQVPLELASFIPLFTRTLQHLRPQGRVKDRKGLIQLYLISDEQMVPLNKQHRRKDGPTDVISLSYLEDSAFPREDLAGEIFISVDTARRQASEHNKSLEEEILFLFVHGVLHLFGYDHEEEAERKVMYDLQDEILETDSWREIIDPPEVG